MNEDLPTRLDKLGDLLNEGWCQCVYARSKSGRKVDQYSDRAVCFCIQGGINRIGGGLTFRQLIRCALAHTLTLELQDSLPNSIAQRIRVREDELASWNDTPGRTKRDAVKLCRDTAQRLRAAAA